MKTSSEDKDERRLQDVFKTSSSRRMFAGLRLQKSEIKGELFNWQTDSRNQAKQTTKPGLKST